MRIAILSRKATLYSTSRLIEACRQRQADVTVLDPLQCVVKLSKKRPDGSLETAERSSGRTPFKATTIFSGSPSTRTRAE